MAIPQDDLDLIAAALAAEFPTEDEDDLCANLVGLLPSSGSTQTSAVTVVVEPEHVKVTFGPAGDIAHCQMSGDVLELWVE